MLKLLLLLVAKNVRILVIASGHLSSERTLFESGSALVLAMLDLSGVSASVERLRLEVIVGANGSGCGGVRGHVMTENIRVVLASLEVACFCHANVELLSD